MCTGSRMNSASGSQEPSGVRTGCLYCFIFESIAEVYEHVRRRVARVVAARSRPDRFFRGRGNAIARRDLTWGS